MSNLLASLSKTIHASLALAILLFVGLSYHNGGFAFRLIVLELVI
jgi:hypothetical protein